MFVLIWCAQNFDRFRIFACRNYYLVLLTISPLDDKLRGLGLRPTDCIVSAYLFCFSTTHFMAVSVNLWELDISAVWLLELRVSWCPPCERERNNYHYYIKKRKEEKREKKVICGKYRNAVSTIESYLSGWCYVIISLEIFPQ